MKKRNVWTERDYWNVCTGSLNLAATTMSSVFRRPNTDTTVYLNQTLILLHTKSSTLTLLLYVYEAGNPKFPAVDSNSSTLQLLFLFFTWVAALVANTAETICYSI